MALKKGGLVVFTNPFWVMFAGTEEVFNDAHERKRVS